MKNTNTGFVHVYTGTGKGKTTSAVGLAVRALGHGVRVCWASFMKRPQNYGYTELDSLKKLGADCFVFSSGHPRFNRGVDSDTLKTEITAALVFLNNHCRENGCGLLVMDEILIALRDGFIDDASLLAFINNKPADLELVMTGRGATASIIDRADYVSVIDAAKHPAQKGVSSREGIEY